MNEKARIKKMKELMNKLHYAACVLNLGTGRGSPKRIRRFLETKYRIPTASPKKNIVSPAIGDLLTVPTTPRPDRGVQQCPPPTSYKRRMKWHKEFYKLLPPLSPASICDDNNSCYSNESTL